VTDNQLIDVSFQATINAPFDKIDIPAWCFTLPEHEYQGCSAAHVAAGFVGLHRDGVDHRRRAGGQHVEHEGR